jgi:ribosomal protein S24E
LKHLTLIISLTCFCCCKTNTLVYKNEFSEILQLEHKTTLKYTKITGHIGSSEWLTYNLKDDTLIIQRKTIAIGSQDLFNNGNVYGQMFKFCKDSLINLTNGTTFYNSEYLKKKNKLIAKKKLYLYVIFEGKKHKITKRNIEHSILSEIDYLSYTTSTIDPQVAYTLYHIPLNYTTLELTRK